VNHPADERVEAARVPQVADRTVSPRNRRLYFLDGVPAPQSVDARERGAGDGFVVL